MKAGFQNDGSVSMEITPEEFKEIVPSLVHSLFKRKEIIIKKRTILEKLLVECHDKDDWKKFVFEKTYLREDQILLLMQKMPFFIKNGVKKRFIENYSISSYKKSNIFFAVLDIFSNNLKKKDIKMIFDRFKDNDQASLYEFLQNVKKENPKLLPKEVDDYLLEKQK